MRVEYQKGGSVIESKIVATPGFGPPGIVKSPPSSGLMRASNTALAHARTALDETPPPPAPESDGAPVGESGQRDYSTRRIT